MQTNVFFAQIAWVDILLSFGWRERRVFCFLTSSSSHSSQSNDLDTKQKLVELLYRCQSFSHQRCKNMYVFSRKSKLKKEQEKSEWHFARDIRAEAYELVEKFVEENIFYKS